MMIKQRCTPYKTEEAKDMIKQRYTPSKTESGANSTIAIGCDSDERDQKYFHHATDKSSSPLRWLVLIALVLSIACILVLDFSITDDSGTEKGAQQEGTSTTRNSWMRLKPKSTPALTEQTGTTGRGVSSSLRKVQVLATTSPVLPPKFVNATYDDLWGHFDCDNYFEGAKRPTDHKPIWEQMRKLYIQSIQPEASVASRLLRENTGILVPYILRDTKDKGLGIFAKEKIAKGTVVDDTRVGGRVSFTQGDDFRRFLHALWTPNLACVAMRCSAVESTTTSAGDTTDPKLGAYISIDLDDNCFMNNDDYQPNVGTLAGGDCRTCDYAFRDIEPGEEILCSYGTYSYAEGWEWFGLRVPSDASSGDESTESEQASADEQKDAENAEIA